MIGNKFVHVQRSEKRHITVTDPKRRNEINPFGDHFEMTGEHLDASIAFFLALAERRNLPPHLRVPLTVETRSNTYQVTVRQAPAEIPVNKFLRIERRG